MSSGVDSGGIIAAAVMLPVGVAFGAGWLAWQGGKLIVEANRVADRQIAEKKRQQEGRGSPPPADGKVRVHAVLRGGAESFC